MQCNEINFEKSIMKCFDLKKKSHGQIVKSKLLNTCLLSKFKSLCFKNNLWGSLMWW